MPLTPVAPDPASTADDEHRPGESSERTEHRPERHAGHGAAADPPQALARPEKTHEQENGSEYQRQRSAHGRRLVPENRPRRVGATPGSGPLIRSHHLS